MSRVLCCLAVLAGMLLATATAALPDTADLCSWSRDVKLINAKIVTMDEKNSIVSEVTIQDGKFTAVGKVPESKTQRLYQGNRRQGPHRRARTDRQPQSLYLARVAARL